MDFITKKKKIDYHIHTTYSDGKLPVEEVLKIAQKQKVAEISFTDHDNIEVYNYLTKIDVPSLYKGKIVNGCEVAAEFDGYRIEVLVYNFDYKKFEKFEYINRSKRYEKFLYLLKVLSATAKNIGFKIDDKIELNKSYPLVCEALFASMKKYPENQKLIDKYKLDKNKFKGTPSFFSRVMNDKKFIFYAHPSVCLPTIKETYDFAKKCGGTVILPHPNKEKNIKNALTGLRLVKRLHEKGLIDGVEIAHSCNIKIEEIKALNEYCSKNNLIRTFGSDFHGNKVFDGYKCNVGLLTVMQKTSKQIKNML